MYNRYIPQPDGSYRKNRIPDPAPPVQSHRPPQKQEDPQEPPICEPKEQPCPPPAVHNRPPQGHSDAGDFLRRLFPKDIDTGDLLIILLLLLMAGDCKEENNTALLTLALYYFL